jgi:hypothetical protein
LHLDSGYEYLRATPEDLKAVAEILSKTAKNSEIELIPFDDSLDMIPAKHFKPEAPPEEQVLQEVTERLEALQDTRTIGSQKVI